MHYIGVSELRANLLKILKTIEKGSTIVITSRGKAVAKLVPPDDSIEEAENKLAELRKTAKVHDVISPIGEKWKADN